jgi:hypothetical protein
MTRTLTFLAVAVSVSGVALAAESKKNELPAAVQEIVANAESFEILSLDPGRPGRTAAMPKDGFHGWTVLGRTVITDAKQQKALVAALERGVAESDVPARCFDPRHGVRAKRGKVVADLVICFECRHMVAFLDDKESGGALTSVTPKGLLDAALKEAKIPLASELKR